MSTNLFKRFQRLLPQAPLRVGRVLSIADGVIEGSAPDLPVELIEI